MNSPIDPFAPIKKKGRTGADGNEEKCAGMIGEQTGYGLKRRHLI